MPELIFAFDVGKASLGICVRRGNELLLLESLLIPAEFADTSDFRTRRRFFRTREAHYKREAWLVRKWREAGLIVPDRQSYDFSSEFPKRGDNTIRNSALLRIALVQERPLADWQIFKALWAAIQHRGYDPECKWDRQATTEEAPLDEDKKANLDALRKYEESLFVELGTDAAYHLPCYLEASLMGLWNFEKPNEFKLRVDSQADKARGRVAPREYVVRELEALLRNAQKQLPELVGLDIKEWLYGPGLKPYASLQKDFSVHRGSEWDAQGLLSQKVPRFDNRIIDKCGMLPKRNVCKANDKDKLYVQFILLQKLKNLRFRLEVAPEETLEGRLNPEQLRDVAELCKQAIHAKQQKETKHIQLTASELIKLVAKVLGGKIVDHNLAKNDRINWQPSGRASYCRPALEIMNRILGDGRGISPLDFDMTPWAQSGKPNGITLDELEAMRGRLGDSWENFHPGDRRQENLMTARQQSINQRERDILSLIGNVNNPVVRHRLTFIDNKIKELVARFNEPDAVILEFVRGSEGLEGQKSASEWENLIKANTKINDRIREQLKEADLKVTSWNIERVKLAEEQGWHCPYTNQKLCITDLNDYDVDHIVPVSSLIATDAFYNKVLCISSANRGGPDAKNDGTPHEWLSNTDQWENYLSRITQRATLKGGYSPRKKALLTSQKAKELIQNYNGLAETAYVARLTQAMIAMRFAWPLGNTGEKRRIFVTDGRLTAKIRSTYKLNELLLWPDQKAALETTQDVEARRKIWQKNRDNKKHHALDAYCISYARQFRGETKSSGGVRWHAARHNNEPGLEETKVILEQKLRELFPETLKRNKKKMYPLDTMYGYRTQKDEKGVERHYLTTRKVLASFLEIKTLQELKKIKDKIKDIFDPELRNDLEALSEQITNPIEWKKRLSNYQHPRLKSRVKRIQVIESHSNIAPTISEAGRGCFGEYKDFGNRKPEIRTQNYQRQKGITLGQYRRSTANKGQLLIQEGKKWQVYPMLSHEKLEPTLAALKKEGKVLYQHGALFYPQCKIHVPVKFKAGKVELPAGPYNLLSMWSAGPVRISDANGIEYLTSVNYLTAAEFKLVK